jgi:Flp pilus assembly protein TadG
LIEAAITLPMFVLLLLGAVDVTRALYLSEIAVAAARAGAHYALVGNPRTMDLRAIEAAATADAGVPGFSAKATRVCACGNEDAVVCETLKCSREPNSYIQVETTAETTPFLRYPGIEAPLKIHEKALVRVE